MQLQALARAQQCASTPTPKQQQNGAKRGVKAPSKVLPGSAVLLGANAVAASQAVAGPLMGSGSGASASASLPSLPPVSFPAVDLPSLPSVDLSGLSLDGVDPLVVAAGAALVVVPLALGALLGGGGGNKAKAVPAPTALQALEADAGCVLLDIRSKTEAREAGGPNLKGVSKRGPVALPFTVVVKGEVAVDEAFGAKVAATRGVEAEGKPLILLDSDGSLALAASKAILKELPGKKLYYVAGGAEAWQAAGLPWKEHVKFALPSLENINLAAGVNAVVGGVQGVVDDFNEAPTMTKGLLAAGAVAGAGVLLFSQAELLLEVAGIFAAGQFLVKNLLFASDREKTFTEIKKVAAEVDLPDLPEDLSKIATTLLKDDTATASTTTTGKAAPAAAAAAPVAAAAAPSNASSAAPAAEVAQPVAAAAQAE